MRQTGGGPQKKKKKNVPNYLVGAWRVDGLQSGGCVGQDVEVGGGGGPHRSGAILSIHLVVDETPLFQESMHPEQHQF